MSSDARIRPDPLPRDPADVESLDVWGFRDTAFRARPDGVVVLSGGRYSLCGEELADPDEQRVVGVVEALEVGDARVPDVDDSV